GYSFAYAVAVTPTGKIVACGWTGPFLSANTAVARYQATGRLDPTFSGDGKVVTRLSSGDDGCNALALRTGGKILVGSYVKQGTNQNMGFVRYAASGQLDTTFSGDGKQIVD